MMELTRSFAISSMNWWMTHPVTLMGLAQFGIAYAYHNVHIHPADRYLLGMKWKDKIYLDEALPLGLRSVPNIFCALEWILLQAGITCTLTTSRPLDHPASLNANTT